MAGNTVLLPTRSTSALHSRINALTAIGATSINAGMRWGIELLDPGSQPMFANLAAAEAMPMAYADRPYEYDRDDALKVIVLMSDGENFAEQRVNDGYRTGPSPIWRANNGEYSIFDASRVDDHNICGSRPFWVPHYNNKQGAWHPRPWNGGTSNWNNCYDPNADVRNTTNLNWEDVWLDVRVKWVAQQLYARSGIADGRNYNERYSDAVARLQTETSIPDMDDQLQAMCQNARGHGTTVFTISFEAPFAGQLQLTQCASSPSHYFNAQGLEISDAFRAIAAQINRLRLVESSAGP